VDEVELKYRLDRSGERRLREVLTRTGQFGTFAAAPAGQEEHSDTYFDHDGRLRRLGWSLRVRERADGTRVTLKVPHDAVHAGSAMDREEIENTGASDAADVFADIAGRLREAGVIAHDAAVPDVLARGLLGAAEKLGLTVIFAVRTSRTQWRLSRAGQPVADLVLDASRYAVGDTEELPEYQAEIELADRTAEAALDEVARCEHGLAPTRESKFLRGLQFHSATALGEVVEAKLDLPGASAFAAAEKMLRGDPGVIRGYQILGEGFERHIRDVYYDTAALDLARAHCYLRVRDENGDRKLYLRRVAPAGQGHLPVQDEYKGRDAADDFATSWRVVGAVAGKLLRRSPGDGPGGMTAGLKQLGLLPSLTASITRLTWIVQSLDDDRQVAKIKLDDVTFEDGNGGQRRHSEIEITGLEDHPAAPGALDNEAFRMFMSLFRWTCAQRVFRADVTPELHVGTKYHTGLRLFGRLDDPAATFPGSALIRQASSWSSFQPQARSSLLWAVVFVVLSALGLSALVAALPGGWQLAVSGGGVILIAAACLALVQDRSVLISWRIRKQMVVAVATLGAALIAVKFGSKVAADLVGLIGFPLTVLGLLALNNRESSG